MPICFMNTTFNATINLFIFILVLLHSVSYKKYYVENLKILWHYIADIIFNTVVCTAHYRGKFLFTSNTKIQLKQSNHYYYYYYTILYYINILSIWNAYMQCVSLDLYVYPTMSIPTGRPNPICFYGHFYDIKTFRANN